MFLIVATVETAQELGDLIEAIGADRTVVVLLTASPKLVAERLGGTGAGSLAGQGGPPCSTRVKVASEVLGVSTRRMRDALISGTNDPELLAELAKGRTLHKKIAALKEAMNCRSSGHHALLVGQMLAQIDFLDETIGILSARIGRPEARPSPNVYFRFSRDVARADCARPGTAPSCPGLTVA